MTSPYHEPAERELIEQLMIDLDQDGHVYDFTAVHGASMIELFFRTEAKTPGHVDVRVLLKNDGTWEVMHVPAPIKVDDTFSAYDANVGHAEGWGMFDVDGRWALQRDDEKGIFDTDADALIYVAHQAPNSELHRAAIDMIGTLVE